MSIYVPSELRKRVRDHFDNSCAYCQTAESLTVAIFEIEHIHPRSAGGETVFENLCLACPTCNRYKSDRITAATSDDREVGLFNPQRDDWTEHFYWSDDGAELLSRTSIAEVTIKLLKMNRPQLVRVRRMWVAMNEHPPK